MKKKILVWITEPLLARNGGPSTYLYNVRQHFRSDNIELCFLSDLIPGPAVQTKIEAGGFKSAIRKILPYALLKKHRKKMSYKYALGNYKPIAITPDIDIHSFHAVHFHSSVEMVQALHLFNDFDGKIIFTPHTPCPPFQHDLNHLNLNKQNVPAEIYRQIVLSDLKSFEKADILILPCKESVSAYYEAYLPFADLRELISRKQKYYIPTGVSESHYRRNAVDIRKELGISENQFVVHFSGRHNEEKGYDIFVEFGKKILEDFSDVYILVTGKTNPSIPHPENTRWIEVGWTDDPFSYSNASDVFFLPNRITYFDLVLIEMLSVGLPVAISDSGGNRYFREVEKEMDINYFEPGNIEEMIRSFGFFYRTKPGKKRNREVYEKLFTARRFADKYNEVYNKILNADGS